jgi:4-amino-4-deoxy-L-arabinose transferase-like glycosyltransferase
MFGPPAAFLSALVLATSVEHIILSRAVVHDISLAFCVTLAMTLFFIGYKNERHRKPAFLCGYAALGLAVVAKGPVAAPWYILISLKNPDYLEYFVLKQNIGSFLSRQSRHPRPFYYYIPVLMGGLFPWSLFLPLALWRALRAKAALHGDGLIFALIWFGVIFVFFSVATSKLGTYILPLFPAASLLVGALWHDLLHAPDAGLRKGVLISYLPFAAVMPVVLGYLLLFPPGAFTADTGIAMSLVYLLAAWLTGWVILSGGLVIKKKYKAFIGALTAMAVTLFVLVLIYIVPLLGPLVSCKQLALKLDTLMPPGESIRFYRRARASFLFYTDRTGEVLRNPQQLKEYMDSGQAVYCVFKHDDWQDVAHLHGAMQVIARVSDKLIVSNQKQCR